MKTITCSYRFCATDISVDGKTLYTTASTDAKSRPATCGSCCEPWAVPVRITRVDTTKG
jgi:hypothetical protein